MSAEQPLHAPVRLLIAERSENSAQELDSLLRDAGIATRTRVTDLVGAHDLLATADLMLCNSDLPQLEQLLPQLRLKAPHVPVILVHPPGVAISTTEALRMGAADVVASDDPEALVLVFRRELAHVCRSQHMRDLRRALRETEQRCQLLLQSSKAAIAYVHEGMHIQANAGYLNLFGFSDAEALLGLPLMDLLSKDSAEALKLETKRLRLDDQERVFDFTGTSSAGEPVTGTMTLALAEYDGEQCMQVTVRGVAAQASEPRADADRAAPLTSNGNADANGNGNGSGSGLQPDGVAAFLEDVHGLPDAGGDYRAILVAQIDAFGKLQQVLGLRGAETVAAQLYEVLRGNLENHPCNRLSAHQFAFAVAASGRRQLLERIDALRKLAASPMTEFMGKTVRTTLSIGGAELDDALSGSSAVESALDSAFGAAQRAEAAGGNRLEILTKEAARDDVDSESGAILAQINDAIDNKRFLLLFQPIISLRGEAEEHYEVFLRMLDADDQHIAPKEFLSTAVRYGVAAKIDRWVILQSIKMLAGHRGKGHNTRLTITLTANSIGDPEFLQWLSVAIKAARLPSDAVIFQVTEDDAASQVRQTREFFAGLKAMHCRASLSRFGLVSDPMELLRHMPVDFVKLDGSHVHQLAEEPKRRQAITQTIRDLQALGKLTVIPMVESAGALSALWQAGANYIQGHYLQEPTVEMDFDFNHDD